MKRENIHSLGLQRAMLTELKQTHTETNSAHFKIAISPGCTVCTAVFFSIFSVSASHLISHPSGCEGVCVCVRKCVSACMCVRACVCMRRGTHFPESVWVRSVASCPEDVGFCVSGVLDESRCPNFENLKIAPPSTTPPSSDASQ